MVESTRLKVYIQGARMCSSGGNIVLFWDRPKSGYLHIWSAEISLERLQGGEIWGNIEWSNIVMPADESFQEPKKVLHSVSVTL
ncbi:BnaA10g09710D [Brassica napus]|uniref:BnaA10g09710D protein n=1 Tax=Brassica napus TaxID=3708 RepID=A0A078FX77_BRANA|nr:BnaA10g09710D [Brassica napus]